MNKQQAHTLKLKMARFAEATAMIEWAERAGKSELELSITERDRARIDVYNYIDSLTEEEE